MPALTKAFSTISFSTITFTPLADNASAAPDFELKFLLPCFATVTPAPATTKAVAVDILRVPIPSPPVPTMSIAPSGAFTLTHFERMTEAAAAYSITLSCLVRIAIKRPPICARVAEPSNKISKASMAFSWLNGPFDASAINDLICSLIF